jgi:hypothetical protein
LVIGLWPEIDMVKRMGHSRVLYEVEDRLGVGVDVGAKVGDGAGETVFRIVTGGGDGALKIVTAAFALALQAEGVADEVVVLGEEAFVLGDGGFVFVQDVLKGVEYGRIFPTHFTPCIIRCHQCLIHKIKAIKTG